MIGVVQGRCLGMMWLLEYRWDSSWSVADLKRLLVQQLMIQLLDVAEVKCECFRPKVVL